MKFNSLLILSLFGAMMFFSCSSSSSPEVRLTSPETGEIFFTGATIAVTGVVTDDDDVESVFCKMEGLYEEFEYEFMEDVNTKQVNLSDLILFIPFDTEPGEYTITVSALDITGERGESSVTVKVTN